MRAALSIAWARSRKHSSQDILLSKTEDFRASRTRTRTRAVMASLVLHSPGEPLTRARMTEAGHKGITCGFSADAEAGREADSERER